MHFAWQFSVSFTCAASGRIFAGKNFGEKLLPSHTRVKYNPENDIQHSSDGPANYKSQQFPKRPAKIIQGTPTPRNALPPSCVIRPRAQASKPQPHTVGALLVNRAAARFILRSRSAGSKGYAPACPDVSPVAHPPKPRSAHSAPLTMGRASSS